MKEPSDRGGAAGSLVRQGRPKGKIRVAADADRAGLPNQNLDCVVISVLPLRRPP
jgi:hypothetical protein